ncbi:class I SAM-dependent methyltransferase [Cryobacterium psychrophilum]|uniref:Methyltransferase domain-containing protein n=1 Tax=Cryobacterium psychrophilum TaxID=41988 RepID=A0A4Y8KQX8_9MICO|nr:methyltransferase [Cryobacterium psychrophilum]TDW29011.1 16S rRNA m(2)G 1207 methyltransferase [Cryobacterium psychrophilum]TFD79770.1 methyltransferase domain-containing protein [Cryobacterium psychrophilum]
MSSDHYFSPAPGTELRTRTIEVELNGATHEVTTANNVFSPGHIDTGTEVLIKYAPAPPLAGDFLDLGCGWGPISLHLALVSPEATIWAVDVNERALALVRMNAERLGLTNIRAVLPGDVPEDIRFRTIWSNPPIRVGKDELHKLMQTWLPRLEPGSDAWLVVQRNLGSDSLQRWLEAELSDECTVSRESISKGFRVMRVDRASTI